ncbi:arylesterase [Thiopseudomonas alkaliphila]|uniref:arylesterase n=1 Tax=Thiopseudomonas alkaliphila TaxID=1697053 RepID=UPI00257865D8|nr:arylesterase [Thiopseudomonas alkaliphila]MDM1708581.1 arylesterase [Thiopseudomonas alkaliphila]
MKKWLSKIALVAYLAVGLVSAAFAQTVLVVGDSISAAYGLETQQGWVALLEQKIKQANISARVVNASISGDTTAGGLQRLPQLLAEHQPSVVVLELGGNDGLRGLSLDAMHANLQQMIELAKAQQAQVVLLGMQLPPNYGPRYTQNFAKVYQQLATEHEIRLVPFFLEGIGGVAGMMQADGIHPVAEAQPILLANVWPILEQVLMP